jgi:hypothetical protein
LSARGGGNRHPASRLAGALLGATLEGIMADNKILSFPGSHRPAGAAKERKPDEVAAAQPGPAKPGAPAAPGVFTAEQIKAIQLAQSGMSFVMIAIKPSEGGADFFTAVHGEGSELRNAQDHLGGVIERAFARKGL